MKRKQLDLAQSCMKWTMSRSIIGSCLADCSLLTENWMTAMFGRLIAIVWAYDLHCYHYLWLWWWNAFASSMISMDSSCRIALDRNSEWEWLRPASIRKYLWSGVDLMALIYSLQPIRNLWLLLVTANSICHTICWLLLEHYRYDKFVDRVLRWACDA